MIQKMLKLIFILLVLLNGQAFARHKKVIKKKPILNVSKFTGPCSKAKECVSVKADACGCANGGKNRAVLKKKLNDYEKNLRQYLIDIDQKNVVCLALYKCGGEPNQIRCIKRKCVLK